MSARLSPHAAHRGGHSQCSFAQLNRCDCAADARQTFVLPPFAEVVHVEGFRMGGNLVTYAIVPAERRHKQLLLPLGPSQAWAGDSTDYVATEVCDRLAMWASNLLNRMHGLPEPWGLMALPRAVLLDILQRCDRDSLLAMACTCSGLRKAADDDAIWAHRYQQDWSAAPEQVRRRRGRNLIIS